MTIPVPGQLFTIVVHNVMIARLGTLTGGVGRHSLVTSSLFAMSTTILPDQPVDAPSFETRPTLQYAATVGMQAALVGAFVSSVQNALGSHSKGATGFLSRTGGTIGFFGRSQNNISSSYE